MSLPLGEWESGPEDSKVTGIHASLTKLGTVLLFHCRSYPMWSRLYTPYTNQMNEENLIVPIWPKVYYDVSVDPPIPVYLIQPSAIFCSGHCFMADGRLLVAGGERPRPYEYLVNGHPVAPDRGLRYSFIFNPQSESDPWSVAGNPTSPHIMNYGRWYPTLTILEDARILAMGGKGDELDSLGNSLISRVPEIYSDSTGWVELNDPLARMPYDIFYWYPDAHVIPMGDSAGKIFYASTQLIPPEYSETGFPQIFNPNPTGSELYWTPVSKRPTPSEGTSGLILPIRKGSNAKAKFLMTGGWWIDFLNRMDVIDLTNTNSEPDWIQTTPMANARTDHYGIILPDRSLLIVGGVNSNGYVNTPELLDTDTMEWISNNLPPMPIGRGYHSTGLLLPNAKVLMSGGRITDGGDTEDDTERRLSVFKPGYLMDGDQPVISTFPTEVTYGSTFNITLNESTSLDSIAFIKPGSVTHGNNMDQRYVELEFNILGPTNSFTVTAPANAKIAPPGYYMLFVLKDKSLSNSGLSKIPSNAVFIKLSLPN